MENRYQYLMLKLMEECSEISQNASKCFLFGYHSVDPNHPEEGTNKHKLHNELNDLYAIVEELNEKYGLGFVPNPDKIREKKDKMEKYRLLSLGNK